MEFQHLSTFAVAPAIQKEVVVRTLRELTDEIEEYPVLALQRLKNLADAIEARGVR